MAREGKSYMDIVNQWKRITDELERRSGGVEYAISGDRNIALYERATDAARCYTRNIEHSPEGARPLPGKKGERFLNKVFPRSTYMGMDVEEKKDLVQKSERIFYASVAFLQDGEGTGLDELLDKQDYQGLGRLAMEYEQGNAPDLVETRLSPTHYRGDDVVYEDDAYALVYNPVVGGSYNLMRKIPESEVRVLIERYGLPEHATKEVRDVARSMDSYYDLGLGKEVVNASTPNAISGTKAAIIGSGSAHSEDAPYFLDATVFRMRDGGYAMRGNLGSLHLLPKKLTAEEQQAYFGADDNKQKATVLQKIMARRYADEVKGAGYDSRRGLSL